MSMKTMSFIVGLIVGAIIGLTIGTISVGDGLRPRPIAAVKATAAQSISNQFDTVNQQLAASFTAYQQLAQNAQAADAQNVVEMAVMSRAMAAYAGQSKWDKLIAKARADLIAELKRAQEQAQARQTTPVVKE